MHWLFPKGGDAIATNPSKIHSRQLMQTDTKAGMIWGEEMFEAGSDFAFGGR